MTPPRVLPNVHDPDTAGFWSAAARHQLALLFCDTCGKLVHLPMGLCPRCGGSALAWQDVRGAGSVVSWTVVRRQSHPSFKTPFTLLLVQLEEHPSARLVGRLIEDEGAISAGTPVHVHFEQLTDEIALPQWRRTPST